MRGVHTGRRPEDAVPLFKRRGSEPEKGAPSPQPSAPAGLPEEVVAQEYQLKLYYAGKSTEGVRLKAGPRALAELQYMLIWIASGEVDVVYPLELEYAHSVFHIAPPSE